MIVHDLVFLRLLLFSNRTFLLPGLNKLLRLLASITFFLQLFSELIFIKLLDRILQVFLFRWTCNINYIFRNLLISANLRFSTSFVTQSLSVLDLATQIIILRTLTDSYGFIFFINERVQDPSN